MHMSQGVKTLNPKGFSLVFGNNTLTVFGSPQFKSDTGDKNSRLVTSHLDLERLGQNLL